MKIPKSKVLRAAGQALAHSLKTLPFELLGYFVVPFLYRYRQVPLSIMKTKHPWLLPWVNPEDWTSGWRAHPPEYETIPKDLLPVPRHAQQSFRT
jgi:hypothetical protein